MFGCEALKGLGCWISKGLGLGLEPALVSLSTILKLPIYCVLEYA